MNDMLSKEKKEQVNRTMSKFLQPIPSQLMPPNHLGFQKTIIN
jgi:hypothetical protein